MAQLTSTNIFGTLHVSGGQIINSFLTVNAPTTLNGILHIGHPTYSGGFIDHPVGTYLTAGACYDGSAWRSLNASVRAMDFSLGNNLFSWRTSNSSNVPVGDTVTLVNLMALTATTGLTLNAQMAISNQNNSKTYYGPNSSWGGYLAVGAGPDGRNATTAQVISTNGNLHLDSGDDGGGDGKSIKLNYYANTPVTIGNTDSADSKLIVSGNVNTAVRINGSNSPRLVLSVNDSPIGYVWGESSYFAFGLGSFSNSYYIDRATNNFAIGSCEPLGYKLRVAGNTFIEGKGLFIGSGNDFNSGGVEVQGNGTANTIFPNIGFHQPGLYASSLQLRGGADFRFFAQGAASYAYVSFASPTLAEHGATKGYVDSVVGTGLQVSPGSSILVDDGRQVAMGDLGTYTFASSIRNFVATGTVRVYWEMLRTGSDTDDIMARVYKDGTLVYDGPRVRPSVFTAYSFDIAVSPGSKFDLFLYTEGSNGVTWRNFSLRISVYHPALRYINDALSNTL